MAHIALPGASGQVGSRILKERLSERNIPAPALYCLMLIKE